MPGVSDQVGDGCDQQGGVHHGVFQASDPPA